MPRSYNTRPAAVRFWAKVDKSGDCWLWLAGHDAYGYGVFNVRRDGKNRTITAHRFSYTLANGPVPDGLMVLHTCDVRDCVNPAHLYAGTAAQNTADKFNRGRANLPAGDEHWSRRNPTSVPRGERQPHARMTEQKVRDMRQRYANGATLNELVAEFGLSKSATCQIVHRQRWRHVA